MKWNSFRFRLSLWNAAVLVVVLGGFGLAFCYSSQHRLQATLDEDLQIRARQFASQMSVFFPHNFDSRSGHTSHRTPPGFFPHAPWPSTPKTAPAPAHNPPHDAHPEHMVAIFNDEAMRLAAIRRPRLLNRDGKTIGPFNEGPWDTASYADALNGQEGFATASFAGVRVRVCSVPCWNHNKIVGVVQMARELTDYETQTGSQFRTLWMLLPISLAVAWLGSLFLTNRALRPIRAVTHAAAHIGDQDLSRRLQVEGKDELAELSATFNSMIARLQAAFLGRERAYNQLEGAFEQQRRFTADASHELRTPLSRIKVTTSMALMEEQSVEEYRRALQITDKAADAMGALIQQLLLLSRADVGQLAGRSVPIEAAELLCEAVSCLPETGHAPIRMALPEERLWICGDPDHLRRVFLNLLENALRHTPAEGCIILAAERKEDQVVFTVTDTGEGIPAEHLPHVLERFYRVDAARRRGAGGCGLGLAIALSIVQAHDGILTLASEVGQGTVATVTLPGAAPESLP